MSLSTNVKRFRRAYGISQEYMGMKLSMSQASYSRLENDNAKCGRHLIRIAAALDTTPEVLQQYHLAKESNSFSETDDSLEVLLAEKEGIIQSKEAYIEFLNLFIKYTQAVWQKYLGGGFADG